jgi:transposase
LDVVGILPPGDELVRQIENSIFVQEAQRRLRLNMGRSAKGLRMLEELLQRRLNKARAAAETAQEGQAVRKRGRGRPPSHDITKVNEAVEALKAGKPWTEVARILYGRCSKEDVQNAQSYLSAHLKKHGSSLRKLRQQSRVNSQ